MGRLSTLSLLVLCALVALGCESNEERRPVTVTRERSQAVLGTAVVTEPAPTSRAVASVAVPKQPRRLCGGSLNRELGRVSSTLPERREAPGEPSLPEELPFSRHRFTWVNFWAAWCVPCKEEIPLLVAWEDKLQKSGRDVRLVFMSLDDDERQLKAFLASQPSTGLRRTYHLREGSPRSDWLSPVGMKSDMQLPAHLLIDSAGRVRCRIDGAIEPHDYESLVGLLDAVR